MNIMPIETEPTLHRRRSRRLKGYDYSQAGAYFITICTHNHECMFGHISDGEMVLNDAGRMIEKWFQKLPTKFDGIVSDEYVVMPNHIHFVIENIGSVGADPCVCPRNNDVNADDFGNRRTGEHAGSPLQKIVQWFKTMTTNEYIRNIKENKRQSTNGKLWQRNYYEHVIRNESDQNRIRQYILDNPARWADDENNPERMK
jgi:putative transposase